MPTVSRKDGTDVPSSRPRPRRMMSPPRDDSRYYIGGVPVDSKEYVWEANSASYRDKRGRSRRRSSSQHPPSSSPPSCRPRGRSGSRQRSRRPSGNPDPPSDDSSSETIDTTSQGSGETQSHLLLSLDKHNGDNLRLYLLFPLAPVCGSGIKRSRLSFGRRVFGKTSAML